MKFPHFLELVARDVVSRFGNRLADVTVVFPGKRARLFFNQYLYRELQSPVWSPRYLAIDELFDEFSSFRNADTLLLTGLLYRSYKCVYEKRYGKPLTESLDEFFHFGEILINDFDDVDKNLVNADSLFRNLNDLDRLKDDFSHLSEGQREEISRRFGKAFSGDSELQEAFRTVWNILGEVYSHFKSALVERNLAYRGMLMRDVAECESLNINTGKFIFVGFNALSKSEEILFEKLKNNALFYWDLDEYYSEFDSGKIIRDNIKKFGSALDVSANRYFHDGGKKITFIASQSESGQSGIIHQWLDSLGNKPDETTPNSVIVLCNEALLPVVMHSVDPAKAANVNITMGFPLMQTPVASLILRLSDMQVKGAAQNNSFYYKYVLPVLRHPYVTLIYPQATATAKHIAEQNYFYPGIAILENTLLFSQTTDALSLCRYLLEITETVGKLNSTNNHLPQSSGISGDVYEDLYGESIFRAWQVLNRLHGLLQLEEWKLEKPAFMRLLVKLFSITQIPFHGEPVKGLQIMGLLETRTLDFSNLLILSTNEGFMPAGQTQGTSFIPRFIRHELSLGTSEREDSIYEYYFYRLLQRAENITLAYSTDKTQTGKAEMSRFMLQLLIDPQINVQRFRLQSSVKPIDKPPVVIEKTPSIMSQIKNLYDLNTNRYAHPLSPSSLNILIDCSLRFYYLKIQQYKSDEEMTAEMDASIFGTIFHHAAELLYNSLADRYGRNPDGSLFVERAYLEDFLGDGAEIKIEKFVGRAFTKNLFNDRNVPRTEYNGIQLINFHVICRMIKRLIQFDLQRAPFTILALEWNNYEDYELPDTDVTVRIGGVVDRLEESGGKIMIIDYKTGGTGKSFKALDDLIIQKKDRAAHIFQIFVYSSVLARQNRFDKPVLPALFYMQDAGKDDFSPVIKYGEEPLEGFRNLSRNFEPLFIQKAGELFNVDIPFEQTTIDENCKYCEFQELCRVNRTKNK
jgi:hypothetical protein